MWLGGFFMFFKTLFLTTFPRRLVRGEIKSFLEGVNLVHKRSLALLYAGLTITDEDIDALVKS